MKKYLVVLFLSFFMITFITQVDAGDDLENITIQLKHQQEWLGGDYPANWNADREVEYQSNKRNEHVARAGSLVFPGLGHFYAGDNTKGSGFLAANLLQLGLMTWGSAHNTTTTAHGYTRTEPNAPVIASIAGISMVLTRLWEFVDVGRIVNVENAKLKRDLANNSEYNSSNQSQTNQVIESEETIEKADAKETSDEKKDDTEEQIIEEESYEIEAEDELEEIDDVTISGFGTTTPLYGSAQRELVDGRDHITGLRGLNWGLGYTSRNYFGDGLAIEEGSGYFEYGTVGLILPYLGIGYSYRFSENAFATMGIPAGLQFAVTF